MLLFSAIPALAVGSLELGVATLTGTNVTFDVTLVNDPTIQLSALGVDITFNKDVFGIIPDPDSGPGFALNAEIGAVAVTAKKTLDQSNPPDALNVLRFALSGKTTTIGDGVVAKITFPIKNATPGTYTFKISPTGSDKNSTPYTLTGKDTTFTIQAQPATVTTFTIPSTVESLTIPISTFTAANATGFIVTESATAPAASDSKWTTAAPTSYLASSYGAKTLYAWVKNATGTVSASVSASTTLTQPAEPAATITKFEIPATGTSFIIPITTFTASANAVAFLVTESATAPAAAAITAATAPTTFGPVTGYGDHTLYAWVKNAAGAVSASASAKTTLSSVPAPVLTVNTLADKSLTKNNTLNITGSATKNPAVTDASGVVAKLTVNGNAVTLAADGTFSTAVTLVEGPNTITIVASDSTTPTPVATTDIRTITYDSTAPTLSITAPADNLQTNVATVTITGTVNETSTVAISQNGGASQPATMSGTTFSLPVTLVEGDNTFSLVATDVATNSSSASQLKVKLDTSKPTLAIIDPATDITTTLATYLVKGTTNGSTIDFKVDGVSVAPAPVVTSGTFEQNVTLTSAVNTTRAISVTTTNAAGSTTTVQRNINFSVLGLADALRALRISVGLETYTEATDKAFDVAPLALLNGQYVPKGDGVVDAGDAGVILRKVAGFEVW
jgi:hypothetical protein